MAGAPAEEPTPAGVPTAVSAALADADATSPVLETAVAVLWRSVQLVFGTVRSSSNHSSPESGSFTMPEA